MVLIFMVYGVYTAMTAGVERAFIAEIAPSHLKGTMLGLHSTLVGIALLPASIIAGGALGWHRCICTICVWRNTVVVFCIFIGGKAQEYCYGGVNLYVKKQAATACFFSTHRTYMNVFQCVLHDTSLYLLF